MPASRRIRSVLGAYTRSVSNKLFRALNPGDRLDHLVVGAGLDRKVHRRVVAEMRPSSTVGSLRKKYAKKQAT